MNKAKLLHTFKIYKLFKPFYSGIGHVLMFHRVGNNREYMFNSDLMVGTGFLEEALKYFISRDIDIISLDECYNRIVSGKRTRRFVAITFDDGYRDNLTHALPVLEKYNAPFTVFLITAFPDHRMILWWYLLEELVMNNPEIEFSDNGRSFSYATSTEAEKKAAFWEIRRYIMNSDQEQLIPVFRNIFNAGEEKLYEPVRQMALSWEQVRELAGHPLVTMGAHTVNHALRSLSSPAATACPVPCWPCPLRCRREVQVWREPSGRRWTIRETKGPAPSAVTSCHPAGNGSGGLPWRAGISARTGVPALWACARTGTRSARPPWPDRPVAFRRDRG